MAAPLECGSGTGVPTLGADGILSVQEADGLAFINQLIAMVSSERMLSISAKVVDARICINADQTCSAGVKS
jgi:hypothetical protein